MDNAYVWLDGQALRYSDNVALHVCAKIMPLVHVASHLTLII